MAVAISAALQISADPPCLVAYSAANQPIRARQDGKGVHRKRAGHALNATAILHSYPTQAL